MKRPSTRSSASVAVVAALLAPAGALAQSPAGSEFQVNAYTTNSQQRPRITFADGGDFVVTWLSQKSHPIVFDILARRYSADGTPLSGETAVDFPVFSGTLGGIASNARGEFVVVWYSQVTAVPNTIRVLGRRIGVTGAPLGERFLLGDPYGSFEPDVAMDAAGNFLVVWVSQRGSGLDQISGQRFDASGAFIGSEFVVHSYLDGRGSEPAVSLSPVGGFVVWSSPDGSGYGVFGRRIDASGIPVGAEFRVNEVTTDRQRRPAVTVGPSGLAVVVWEDSRLGSGSHDLYGQRLDASGAPIGSEFRVNTQVANQQPGPSLSSDSAGDFVVSWDSYLQDGSGAGVFARRFRADASPRGDEFRVNTTIANDQFQARVASDRDGNFVVAWTSRAQDGSSDGVYAQRYGGLQAAALEVDGQGNGVFEPGEAVPVKPSWRNVNAGDETFSGALARFTGPGPATYEIVDGAGDYGTVAGGAVGQCVDCYRVAVAGGARPALHWDAALEEALQPEAQGQARRWAVHLGNSFTDVPAASSFYRFVETLLHAGVTSGCGGALYCPLASVARDQMAVFVLVGKEGPGYRPRACGAPRFLDVPNDSPFCPFVEELARRGVAGGCGGGNYCPSAPVTREQMPVFVLRTLDPTLEPSACTVPLFADVPVNSPYCRWIEELARRGVVSGCGGGNYCPSAPVARADGGVHRPGLRPHAIRGLRSSIWSSHNT